MHALAAKLCLVAALSLVAAPAATQSVEVAKQGVQYKRYPRDMGRVAAEVSKRAKQLRLTEWEIGVRFDTLPPDAKARSYIRPRQRQMLVVLDWSKREVRETMCSTVLHELLHAKISPLTRLTFLLSEYGEAALEETIKDTEEQLVLDLARVDVWDCDD